MPFPIVQGSSLVLLKKIQIHTYVLLGGLVRRDYGKDAHGVGDARRGLGISLLWQDRYIPNKNYWKNPYL